MHVHYEGYLPKYGENPEVGTTGTPPPHCTCGGSLFDALGQLCTSKVLARHGAALQSITAQIPIAPSDFSPLLTLWECERSKARRGLETRPAPREPRLPPHTGAL